MEWNRLSLHYYQRCGWGWVRSWLLNLTISLPTSGYTDSDSLYHSIQTSIRPPLVSSRCRCWLWYKLALKAIQPRLRNIPLDPTHKNSSCRTIIQNSHLCSPSLLFPVFSHNQDSFFLIVSTNLLFICNFTPLSCPEPLYKTCFFFSVFLYSLFRK